MGALLSKVIEDITPQQLSDETDTVVIEEDNKNTPTRIRDPRSPATANIDRTPLPSTVAHENQVAWDPRSPTAGIVRTPLNPPLFETPPDTPENMAGPPPMADTAWPHAIPDTAGLQEAAGPQPNAVTRQIVECDVHRQLENESVLEEWDSLYANPGSEVSRSDQGSLQNLLLDNTDSLLDNSQGDVLEDNTACQALAADPGVSPIGSPVKSEPASKETSAVRSSTPLKLGEAKLPSVFDNNSSTNQHTTSPSEMVDKSSRKGLALRNSNSPLASRASPSNKRLATRDTNSPLVSSDKLSRGLVPRESNSPLMPRDKLSSKGLATRDSPLALLRQKQLSKASSQLVSKDNSSSMLDKENLFYES